MPHNLGGHGKDERRGGTQALPSAVIALRDPGRLKFIVAIGPEISTETVLVIGTVEILRCRCDWHKRGLVVASDAR
jgi:hypothetical protein